MFITKKWRIFGNILGLIWFLFLFLLFFLPLAKSVIPGLAVSRIYALGDIIDSILSSGPIYGDPPEDYPIIIPILLFLGFILFLGATSYLIRYTQSKESHRVKSSTQTKKKKRIEIRVKNFDDVDKTTKSFWLGEGLLLVVGGLVALTGWILFRQYINNHYPGYSFTLFYYLLLASILLGLVLGLGSLGIMLFMFLKKDSTISTKEEATTKKKESPTMSSERLALIFPRENRQGINNNQKNKTNLSKE